MKNLGQTRSSFQRDHFLQTPDSFIRAPLPGMKEGMAIVHAGPASGAGFCQYTAELATGGTLGPTAEQRFLYVLTGRLYIGTSSSSFELDAGGFAYLPAGTAYGIRALSECKVAVIEKKYQFLPEIDRPAFLIGRESDVMAQPLMGDKALQIRMLLPDNPSFDFAVNTMTFEPGATLSLVEMHVMEHGLLMLQGGGIYRLNDSWYSVTAGDFIYMAPFCPQWFGALGKTPTKYLIYKDWNRHPAGEA